MAEETVETTEVVENIAAEATPAVEETPVAAVHAEAEAPVVEAVAEVPVVEAVAADSAVVENAVLAEAAEEAPAAKKPRAVRTKKVEEPVVVEKAPFVVDFGNDKKVYRGHRRTRVGKVVSNKMQKTIVVAVESRVRHPLYGKFMKRTTKFKVHDELNTCGEGDTVEIMETRPISSEKRWRFNRIVERAK